MTPEAWITGAKKTIARILRAHSVEVDEKGAVTFVNCHCGTCLQFRSLIESTIQFPTHYPTGLILYDAKGNEFNMDKFIK